MVATLSSIVIVSFLFHVPIQSDGSTFYTRVDERAHGFFGVSTVAELDKRNTKNGRGSEHGLSATNERERERERVTYPLLWPKLRSIGRLTSTTGPKGSNMLRTFSAVKWYGILPQNKEEVVWRSFLKTGKKRMRVKWIGQSDKCRHRETTVLPVIMIVP